MVHNRNMRIPYPFWLNETKSAIMAEASSSKSNDAEADDEGEYDPFAPVEGIDAFDDTPADGIEDAFEGMSTDELRAELMGHMPAPSEDDEAMKPPPPLVPVQETADVLPPVTTATAKKMLATKGPMSHCGPAIFPSRL